MISERIRVAPVILVHTLIHWFSLYRTARRPCKIYNNDIARKEYKVVNTSNE